MNRKLVTVFTLSIMTMALLIGCGQTKEKKEVNTILSDDVVSEDIVSENEVSSNVVSENTVVSENVVSDNTIVSENVVSENTATVEPAVTEVVQAPTYTYADASATKYAKSSVNVRDLPDKNGAKLGALAMNDEVKVTGQCNETGWYRIEFNGVVGYVSNSFLVDNKIVVAEAPVAQTPVATTETAPVAQTAANPYPLYQVIDEGDLNVYFYALDYGDAVTTILAYRTTYDACEELLYSRSGAKGSYGSGHSYTGYTVDGYPVAKFTIGLLYR